MAQQKILIRDDKPDLLGTVYQLLVKDYLVVENKRPSHLIRIERTVRVREDVVEEVSRKKQVVVDLPVDLDSQEVVIEEEVDVRPDSPVNFKS